MDLESTDRYRSVWIDVAVVADVNALATALVTALVCRFRKFSRTDM